jgi:hypothetical protein
MLCCQMGVKSLKMPPANQAFNRIAAEITLDLATRPKDRSSLGPYHLWLELVLVAPLVVVSVMLALAYPRFAPTYIPVQS